MKITSKSIARSAIVAALYVVLTLPLGQLATVPFFQIRPAEGLTLLPTLLPSSVIGLAVGCAVVNLITSSAIDALIGGLITLIASFLTKIVKNPFIGGIFPVVLNAVGLPTVFLIMGYELTYWYMFLQILISQTVWVYGIGIPLYFAIKKLSIKNDWILKN